MAKAQEGDEAGLGFAQAVRSVRKIFRKFESERVHATAGHEAKWGRELMVEVSYDELDHVWVSDCVDLPGCMSQGDTVGEALENVVDAIGGVLTLRMQSQLPKQIEPAAADRRSSRTIALCV